VLFENLSLNIEKGQKVALIAKNGAGKTSLLNILTGNDTPDTGRVILSKDIHLGFLAQEPDLNDDDTISEAILSPDNVMLAAITDYEDIMERHAESPTPQNLAALENAINHIDILKAWDYE